MFKLGKVVEVALKKKVARPLKNENFGLKFSDTLFWRNFFFFFCRFSVQRQIYNYTHKSTWGRPSLTSVPNATRPLPTLVTSHNTPGYIWESNLTSKHKNILSGSLITMLKIVAKTNLFSCLVAIKNYFDKFSFSHIYLHRANQSNIL